MMTILFFLCITSAGLRADLPEVRGAKPGVFLAFHREEDREGKALLPRAGLLARFDVDLA